MYVQKPLESLHISTNNIDRNAAGWTKDAWFTEYAATAILKPNRQWTQLRYGSNGKLASGKQ